MAMDKNNGIGKDKRASGQPQRHRKHFILKWNAAG